MNLIKTLFPGRQGRKTYETLRSLDDRMLRDIGFERDRHGQFLGRDFARLQDFR